MSMKKVVSMKVYIQSFGKLGKDELLKTNSVEKAYAKQVWKDWGEPYKR